MGTSGWRLREGVSELEERLRGRRVEWIDSSLAGWMVGEDGVLERVDGG